jgi:Flp pilus assembly protein TadG
MVEFAIVAPLLFLFFFTAFEFCRVAMVRHTVDNAVYESVRKGIIPGATASEVRDRGERVLSTVGIQNFTIDVTPAVINDDTDDITVRIRVPLRENTFIPPTFFEDLVTDRTLTMVREGR